MNIETTNIDGVIILKPKKYDDDRGFFTELYSIRKYTSNIIPQKSVHPIRTQRPHRHERRRANLKPGLARKRCQSHRW